MLTPHTEIPAEGATPPVEGAPRANRSPEELEMRAAIRDKFSWRLERPTSPLRRLPQQSPFALAVVVRGVGVPWRRVPHHFRFNAYPKYTVEKTHEPRPFFLTSPANFAPLRVSSLSQLSVESLWAEDLGHSIS